MQTIAIALVTLLGLAPQQSASRPSVKIVAVGEVTKFDKLKKSFELKTRESDLLGRIPNGQITINVGRLPDATQAGYPPREPQRRPGDIGVPTGGGRLPEFTKTTIFLTETTACKGSDNKAMLCDELKSTDNVRVTGDERSEPRGKGLYAIEIVRTKSK